MSSPYKANRLHDSWFMDWPPEKQPNKKITLEKEKLSPMKKSSCFIFPIKIIPNNCNKRSPSQRDNYSHHNAACFVFIFSHTKPPKKKNPHFLVRPRCDDFKEGVWYGYQTSPQMNLYKLDYTHTHDYVFHETLGAAMEQDHF